MLPIVGLLGLVFLDGTLSFLLISGIVVFYIFEIRRKQNYWERKGIKYVKPKFLLGNIQIIRDKSYIENTQYLYNTFPEERYIGAYQFTQPTLILRDPDLIKQVTVKAFEHFTNHTQSAREDLDPFWSKNLFARSGEKWRDMRSTLSPSFTGSKMKIMFQLINESAQQFVQFFKEKNEDIMELEMRDTFTRFTNDVIASTAFGVTCDSLRQRTNEFYSMGKEASDISGLKILKFSMHGLAPTLSKLLSIKIVPPKVADYFSQMIIDTVKTRKEKDIVRPDMIHLLLEAQKDRLDSEAKREITTDDIISQAFVFFLAGFKTVSTLLSFASYELALNPKIQNRLRKEIQEVSGDVTYETILGLKYLDMVVSETLRKWPASFMTDRRVTKEYTIKPEKPGEMSLHLDKGVSCWLPIFALHNDPKHFPKPEHFDPERFSEENKHKINPSAYIPFGSGPRNCIGSRFALLEAKLLMFHILKNFEIVKIERTPIPIVMDKKEVNMTAEGGMWLGFKKL